MLEATLAVGKAGITVECSFVIRERSLPGSYGDEAAVMHLLSGSNKIKVIYSGALKLEFNWLQRVLLVAKHSTCKTLKYMYSYGENFNSLQTPS